MTIVKAETVPYIEAFRAQAQAGEPDWLTAGREAALARFGSLGFPTRRQEAWRFTDLRPLQRQAFPPAAGGATVSPDALRRYRLDPAAKERVLLFQLIERGVQSRDNCLSLIGNDHQLEIDFFV